MTSFLSVYKVPISPLSEWVANVYQCPMHGSNQKVLDYQSHAVQTEPIGVTHHLEYIKDNIHMSYPNLSVLTYTRGFIMYNNTFTCYSHKYVINRGISCDTSLPTKLFLVCACFQLNPAINVAFGRPLR